jgi:hypothetical protein
MIMALMDDFRRPIRRHGKLHPKSHCSLRRAGIRCTCGSYGKKLRKPPYPYKDNEKVIMKCRKWAKKWGIEIIKYAKELY